MPQQSEFYTLPLDRIAQVPPRTRGTSHLLVLDRATQQLADKAYADVVDYIEPGDVVIINTTRVIKARLEATTETGGKRELFLTEKHAGMAGFGNTARVLYRGKLRVGEALYIGDESVEVVKIFGDGQALIRSTLPASMLAERYGKVPLPPYMKRAARQSDVDRYQTVFAKQAGSVAAPTASLNLTEAIIGQLENKGVIVAPLTLHVGRGTFLPIRTDDLSRHVMHEEYYAIPKATLQSIRQAKQSGHKVIAIGTTVCRALEHASGEIMQDTAAERIRGEADIFIHPGYDFQVVDRLLTNFHAPDSTVLQLAAAFAGEDFLKTAYEHALAGDYRFLSYGDSMLIL